MARAGRKRKSGRRHPNGKLVVTPKIDKGTPEAQARRAYYAFDKSSDRHDPQQTIDPVGRAWCAGLLTEEQRDAGRRFAALYWRKLPDATGNPVSSLYRSMVSGLVDELPPGVSRTLVIEDADERDWRQEQALNRMIKALPRQGTVGRRAFDELVLDPWFDAGPPWLDRMIAELRHGLGWDGIAYEDSKSYFNACDALDVIA